MATNLSKASFPSKGGKAKKTIDGLKPANRANRRAIASKKSKGEIKDGQKRIF